MDTINCVKILTFLFRMNNFFPSPEDTIHICKHDKIIPCVKFQMRTEVWRCFQIKLSLKNYFSLPSFRVLKQSCIRGEGTGAALALGAGWQRLPLLAGGDSPRAGAAGGSHWNRGSVRKSICKGKNLGAPAFGSEQNVLAPNGLCQFTIS